MRLDLLVVAAVVAFLAAAAGDRSPRPPSKREQVTVAPAARPRRDWKPSDRLLY